VRGTQKNLGTWLSEEPRPRLEKPGEIIRTNLGRALSAEEPPKKTNLLQAGLLTWLFDARLLTLSAAQWRRCASNWNEPHSGGDHAGFSPASLFSPSTGGTWRQWQRAGETRRTVPRGRRGVNHRV